MIKLKEILNEVTGREAKEIAKLTGTRDSIVQKFIDDFNLNAKNLFNFIAKGKEKVRKDFATAMSGRPGNRYQGDFVGMFGESIVNEDSETKRLEMLIKNLEETIKLLVQQLKDNKSLPSNKKENIKKSIAVNLDLINYYKKWLKDYQAAANESLVNEACWDGYKQVGGKMKNGRMVPNCVPISEAESAAQQAAIAINMKKKGIKPKTEDINSDDDVNYGLVEPEEYDVEDEDMADFISFMRGYDKNLNEGCQCLREAEYQGRNVQLGKPMQGDIKKFKVYVKNPAGNVVKVNFGQKGMKIRKSNPAARKSFRARMNCDNPGPRTKANYWSCRKW